MTVSVAIEDEPNYDDPLWAAAAQDKALVAETIAGIEANLEAMEELLAHALGMTHEVNLGDMWATGDPDGRLIDFGIAADAMSTYTASEMQDRVNAMLSAILISVQEEHERTVGGGTLE